jgi:raffinose/stachyose/melibiose transport system substrate-binding protein
MKRNRALSLLVVMLIMVTWFMSGCSKEAAKTSQSGDSSKDVVAEDSTEGDSEEAPAKEEQEQITLRFFHYQGEAQAAYETVFKAYEEQHPNVKIEFEFLNSDNYNATLQARIATDDCPDIVGLRPGKALAIPLAEAGYLEDVSNQLCVSDMTEGELKTCSVEGKVYGVPTDQAYICTYYNKKIFSDLGLKVPTTWAEFLSACDTIKAAGITPISLGYKDSWVTQLAHFAIVPTTIYKENMNFDDELYAGTKKFNGEEWQKAFGMLQSLIDNGYVTKNLMSTSYDQQLAGFANGDAAMMIMGSWAVSLMKDLNPDLDFGLFITPASDDGVNWISASVGGMLGVSANSPNKEAAIDFLNYFIGNDEVYAQYLKDTNNLSARVSVIADSDPHLQELSKQVTGSYMFLDANWPTGVQDVLFKVMQEVAMGTSISDGLDQMDAIWQEKTK